MQTGCGSTHGMNLNRLSRQLRREATANPQKAALLGLLLLVAVYFWGPLVLGWISPGEAADETVAVPDAATTRQAIAEAPPSNEGGVLATETFTWQQLEQWRAANPLAKPIAWQSDRRDPFRGSPEIAAVAEDDEETEAEQTVGPLIAELTLESLRLELVSTIVGRGRRVAFLKSDALVDERAPAGHGAYDEGETVTLASDGRQVELVVSEVQPRQVVLCRGAERLVLAMPDRRPTKSTSDRQPIGIERGP